MIHSEIRTFTYPNDDLQRLQCVRFDSFEELKLFQPQYTKDSFDKLCDLYRNFIVKKYPWVYGHLLLFTLPEDISVPFAESDEEYGELYDPLLRVNAAFHKHLKIRKKKIVSDDALTLGFYEQLLKLGCLRLISGRLNTLDILPVGKDFGFLSQSEKQAKLKVNSSFFTMDRLDVGSVYDRIGTPVGLSLMEGSIQSPPLFGRQVFCVDKQNMVSIRGISLKDLNIEVNGHIYRHGLNARIYERPNASHSPEGGSDLVIVNKRVLAQKKGGNCRVPSSGFLLHLEQALDLRSTEVHYSGLESLKFALQVGNSAVINGQRTEKFLSPFYDIRRFWVPSYPPSLYPLNYQKARAPRILLGADRDNKPMLIWMEGAGKFGYEAKRDSCGASLSEAAMLAEKCGMFNAVHLDGGGSAQILLHNEKSLLVSDRDPEDFSEIERAVAAGLMIL